MILVDSSVWIDYFNGTETLATKKLDNLLGVQRLCIGDLILAEVLPGFRLAPAYQAAKKNLLCSLPAHTILGVTLSLKNAENFRNLRKQGITIRKTINTMVATFCIQTLIFSPFNSFWACRLYRAFL